MKISIFLEHLLQAHQQSGKSVEEVFSFAKKCGINGIETNAFFLAFQPELQKKLKDAALTVTQLYENYGWEDFDNDFKMKNHVETAVKTGALKILFIPPYFSDLQKEEETSSEKEKVKLMIKKLCSLAKPYGITVTMEDFDNLKSPSSKTCFLKEYTEEIPELQITFDTGNFLANGENVLDCYPVLRKRVVNVHCKDRLSDISSCVFGTGIIPFEKIFANLREDGYDGNFTLEHFDLDNQLEAVHMSSLKLMEIMTWLNYR